MALSATHRIPYKTKQEKKEADLFLELEEKFRVSDKTRRLRANGARKKHALQDGLSARGYDQDLPAKYCTEWRLYIEVKPSVRAKERKILKQAEKNRALKNAKSKYIAELNSIEQRFSWQGL